MGIQKPRTPLSRFLPSRGSNSGVGEEARGGSTRVSFREVSRLTARVSAGLWRYKLTHSPLATES